MYSVVTVLKKASLVGAFFWLLSSSLYATPRFCTLQQSVPEYAVQHVVDGDTVRLQDGRSVRLIGINAPELAGRGRTAEPYALKATRYLRALLKSNEDKVALRLGEQSRDRYGRVLAHMYDRNGASIAEQLLAAGLAYHVAIAPNAALAACLAQAEQVAREQHLGVWASTNFIQAHELSRGGFTLLQGRIEKVQRNKGGVWLELGHSVTVNVPNTALQYFTAEQFEQWQGRTLKARGWVYERKRQPSKYARWRLTVSHPSMLVLQ